MSKRAGAGVAEDLAGIKQAIDEQFGVISDRVADLTAKYQGEQAAAKELAVLGQTPNATGGGALQVCPVAGLNSFVDSFGRPRVRHSHQGIDLISPAGTPVLTITRVPVGPGESQQPAQDQVQDREEHPRMLRNRCDGARSESFRPTPVKSTRPISRRCVPPASSHRW